MAQEAEHQTWIRLGRSVSLFVPWVPTLLGIGASTGALVNPDVGENKSYMAHIYVCTQGV